MSLPSAMQAKKVKLLQEQQKEPVVLPSMEGVKPSPKAEEAPPLTEDELKVFVADDGVPAPASGAPAPAPASTPAPAPVAAPAPAGEVTPLEEEVKKWKNDYASVFGNLNAVTKENRSLREQLTALEESVGELKRAGTVKVPDPNLELTSDELAAHEASIPVVNKLAAKQAQQLIEQATNSLRKEIDDLKKQNKSVSDKVATESEGVFLANVKNRVKEFDEIVKKPEWTVFTARRASPYTKQTIGEVLWQAHQTRDLDVVHQIFEDFGKLGKPNVADAYRAPPVSGAAAPAPDSGKKPMLKISERKKVSDQFRKGQISLDKYEQIKTLYREAENEGRVDYSK